MLRYFTGGRVRQVRVDRMLTKRSSLSAMYSFVRQGHDADPDISISESDSKAGGDSYKSHKCKLLAHQSIGDLTLKSSLGSSGKYPRGQNLCLASSASASLQPSDL